MNKAPFTIECILNAPLSRVWKAITDKGQMKEWYFDLSDFRPEVGFEFRFPGQGSKGEQYMHLCKITDVISEKRLRYSWSYEGYEGMSYVTFDLFDEGGATRIKLTHEGMETFPALPDFAPGSFAQGWTEIIGTNLKKYVE